MRLAPRLLAMALTSLATGVSAQESGGMPTMGAQAGAAAMRPPADSLRTNTQIRAYVAAVAEGTVPDLSGLDLQGLDLRGIDFRKASFTHANLAGARLDSTNLFSCDLTDAVAHGATFVGANMDVSTLRRADLRQADLHGASLFATILEEADLRGADLRNTRIIGYLRKAQLAGARLNGANIGADPGNQSMGVMRAQFVSADLTGADLSDA
ncbi:MAG TPA: pentapeptide repeat-containing protein, partial [Gemmatimonadales bacterium]|nr:pentapeptide repeat-containing protein [Gemmatimonadales bacterium]